MTMMRGAKTQRPYQPLADQLASPVSSSASSSSSSLSYLEDESKPQESSVASNSVGGEYLQIYRSGGYHIINANHSAEVSGLVTSSCPPQSPSTSTARFETEETETAVALTAFQKDILSGRRSAAVSPPKDDNLVTSSSEQQQGRQAVLSLLFRSCATSLLDSSSSNHKSIHNNDRGAEAPPLSTEATESRSSNNSSKRSSLLNLNKYTSCARTSLLPLSPKPALVPISKHTGTCYSIGGNQNHNRDIHRCHPQSTSRNTENLCQYHPSVVGVKKQQQQQQQQQHYYPFSSSSSNNNTSQQADIGTTPTPLPKTTAQQNSLHIPPAPTNTKARALHHSKSLKKSKTSANDHLSSTSSNCDSNDSSLRYHQHHQAAHTSLALKILESVAEHEKFGWLTHQDAARYRESIFKYIHKASSVSSSSTSSDSSSSKNKFFLEKIAQDIERSVLVQQQIQERHFCTPPSSSHHSLSISSEETASTSSSTGTCCSSTDSTFFSSWEHQQQQQVVYSSPEPPQPPRPKPASILLGGKNHSSPNRRHSKNTMRHISWQDQAATAAAARRAATAATSTSGARSVGTATTAQETSASSSASAPSYAVPSVLSSTSTEETTMTASDKENSGSSTTTSSSIVKDTISRYTPRTTPTSSSSVGSSSINTFNNNSKNNNKEQQSRCILKPSDLWGGAVQFDPQQIQELFVEMCFFARLGFVQPPSCLQCTYRDCNDNSPTPSSNHHHHGAHKTNGCNNKNHRCCQRWVVWRKDANTLLHPNLLDGNVLIVQCQAAQRLLAGEQVDGCFWDATNKQVTPSSP